MGPRNVPGCGAHALLARVPLVISGAAFLLPLAAVSQTFPAKPVRIITAEPGGGNDLAARIIAQELTSAFGQQVVVESRGGASGAIAAQAVARAPADGYTLLLYSSALWVIPLMKEVPWDVARDFAAMVLIAQAPNVLVVHPSLPARSVAELIKLARSRPGELNYSSGGSGAAAHLSAELFKSLSGTSIVRVVYKGTAPGLLALVAGEVQIMFPAAGSVASYVRAGRVRALAVTSSSRSSLVPHLPTLAESGLADYEAVSVYGLFAPAKTPAALINRVSDATVRAIHNPEVRQRFLSSGVEPIGAAADRLEATIRTDSARWGKLIRTAGIRED